MSWKAPLLLWISCLTYCYGLPNIVFVLTDDVDVPLSGLKVKMKLGSENMAIAVRRFM